VIVLDTNVVSEVLKPQPDARVVAWLESLADDVAITAFTLAELLARLRRRTDRGHLPIQGCGLCDTQHEGLHPLRGCAHQPVDR
jgi:predicted nucleic acid-binding protein